MSLPQHKFRKSKFFSRRYLGIYTLAAAALVQKYFNSQGSPLLGNEKSAGNVRRKNKTLLEGIPSVIMHIYYISYLEAVCNNISVEKYEICVSIWVLSEKQKKTF